MVIPVGSCEILRAEWDMEAEAKKAVAKSNTPNEPLPRIEAQPMHSIVADTRLPLGKIEYAES